MSDPAITLYTVPDCRDCEAVGRLLRGAGRDWLEKDVRADPAAHAEMLRVSGVRIAPVVSIGEQVFWGPFDEQRPRLLAALAREETP